MAGTPATVLPILWQGLLTLICALGVRYHINAETAEFCIREDVSITCQDHEMIMITEARYGRMSSGRCISQEYGNIGCAVDVTSVVEGLCSGRTHCQSEVRRLMDIAQPCPRDLTAYLEVKFECMEVATGTPESCRHPQADNHIRVTGAEGYIATRFTQDVGYGTPGCPWLVQVNPGQRINFTLLDFNQGTTDPMDPEHYTGCPLSIIIEDAGHTKTDDICTGGPRERLIHVTSSNSALLHFLVRSTKTRQRHFVLKFKAVGCEDLQVSEQAWMRREGDNVQVQCNVTGEIWYLTCRDGRWIGEVGECEGVIAPTGPPRENNKFPFGLILAVIIGIVLGVVVGVTLLGVVFVCRRGYRGKPKPGGPESYLEQPRTVPGPATDIYSEGLPRFCTPTKPCDPRAISGVLSPDYSYKCALQRKQSAENTPLRKPCDPRGDTELIRKGGRPVNYILTRTHDYESPKGGKVPGCTDEIPPVYNDMDSESGEQHGRFSN